MDQSAEGDRHEQELRERGRAGPGDERAVAARRADERDRRLQNGDAQGEHQGEMPDLGNHPTTLNVLVRLASASIQDWPGKLAFLRHQRTPNEIASSLRSSQ